MNQSKLKEILRKHKLWLNHKKGGKRADLRFADLHGSDLCFVDLRFADMHGAYLNETNLIQAKLREANLRYADLSGSDLSGADLSNANLSNANLHGAMLLHAKLYGADLRYTDLRWVDLREAELGENIILSAGYIGSRIDETIYNATSDTVRCGCFKGTLAGFKLKVAKSYPDKNSQHRREYDAAIAYFKAVAKARKEAQK